VIIRGLLFFTKSISFNSFEGFNKLFGLLAKIILIYFFG
jgi:hypothetical protein